MWARKLGGRAAARAHQVGGRVRGDEQMPILTPEVTLSTPHRLSFSHVGARYFPKNLIHSSSAMHMGIAKRAVSMMVDTSEPMLACTGHRAAAIHVSWRALYTRRADAAWQT